MIVKTVVTCLAALLLVGCSTGPVTVDATYVSPEREKMMKERREMRNSACPMQMVAQRQCRREWELAHPEETQSEVPFNL